MRLIDADALIKDGWILKRFGESNRLVGIKSIADVPTVDAKPVMHASWDYGPNKITPACTNCGKFHRGVIKNYCPNCGAKVDGKINTTKEGDRIRYIRKVLGLSQQKFANKIGYSKGSVQKWELGKAIPHQSTIDAIDAFFEEVCKDD